ncbi:hypothetical protein [Paracoccus salsus]|uniref:hypothetical protein n=1 Tax=Paracoccus salsus TaxID=2911061 RepID=UPI001F1DD254|nr:hypothetical protein [Paracoccus salsus]MCF3973321.1 hypothetical protein [Paracoccus salsus]
MKITAVAGAILIGLLTLGGIAFWYLVPVQLEFVEDPAATAISGGAATETPTSESRVEMEGIMTEDEWPGFELRWANAPEEVVAIARTIAEGGVPDAGTLEPLGAEALSMGYPVPELDFTRNDRPVAYLATLLQEAALAYNVTAAQALLDAGADPWLDLPGAKGVRIGRLIERMASSSGSAPMTEMLFRIARSGHLPQGPDSAVDAVFSGLSSVAEKFASGTGPDARHTAWRLDQVFQVLGTALGREEQANDIRAQLNAFDDAADGGWFLAADEIHSRYDAPLSAPDKGTEIWGP